MQPIAPWAKFPKTGLTKLASTIFETMKPSHADTSAADSGPRVSSKKALELKRSVPRCTFDIDAEGLAFDGEPGRPAAEGRIALESQGLH